MPDGLAAGHQEFVALLEGGVAALGVFGASRIGVGEARVDLFEAFLDRSGFSGLIGSAPALIGERIAFGERGLAGLGVVAA